MPKIESTTPHRHEGASPTSISILVMANNWGDKGASSVCATAQYIADTKNNEVWDELWLLQNDIRTALETARPGTFYPVPDHAEVL